MTLKESIVRVHGHGLLLVTPVAAHHLGGGGNTGGAGPIITTSATMLSRVEPAVAVW